MNQLIALLLVVFLSHPSYSAPTDTNSDLNGPSGIETYAQFANAPDGLRDVVFSYDLTNIKHEDSWQFGATFWLGDASENMAYIALQPYEGYIRAGFYSFDPGATSWAAGCTRGAGGLPGVSCHNFLPVDNYRGRFDLSVTNTGWNTWTGKLIDTASGRGQSQNWLFRHSQHSHVYRSTFLAVDRGSCAT
ncbi:gp24-like protein [Ophiocordyceps camponoti-floridani]|uniref:Gp24-like protein n=1 Tax=Ophiocordyceps camponoti-floridani TaxID=2030778 RepID=A0A8H4Q0C4_9HYPO|nr:gp24-like protein [Ophiocordyceps camponoti-floridani]